MIASRRSTTKNILQALVRGTDPRTGQELPADTILQRVDVIRALIASLEAVQESEQRANRRSHLPESVGQRWSEEEDTRLKEAFERGETTDSLALSHRRTVRAVEARLERLGLIQASDRTVDFRFQLSGARVSRPTDVQDPESLDEGQSGAE
jgi:hypothetical protein